MVLGETRFTFLLHCLMVKVVHKGSPDLCQEICKSHGSFSYHHFFIPKRDLYHHGQTLKTFSEAKLWTPPGFDSGLGDTL